MKPLQEFDPLPDAPDLHRAGRSPHEFYEIYEKRSAAGGLISFDSSNPYPLNTPTLTPEALHGLAGAVVQKIEPHTETHPAAVLMQLLVGLGNLIGRNPFFVIERDRHHCNLFAVIVGKSAKARKGTSWGHARNILRETDPDWTNERIMGGLASGEGLIYELRDPEGEVSPAKDKRLFLHESEFGGVLKVLQRDGNTLSAIIRNAWDTGTLRNLANSNRGKKGESLRASDCHISIVGHITRDELGRLLSANDSANGFANRFLWAFSERTKQLPDGGAIEGVDFSSEIRGLQAAVRAARQRSEMKRTPEAGAYWREIYPALSDDRPGRWGDITSRAEAQTVRLSLLFALLDQADYIGIEHMRAAKALWDYCCDSARWAFAEGIYSTDARRILAFLKKEPATLAEISKRVFQKNASKERIQAGITEIRHLLAERTRDTAGRKATVYSLLDNRQSVQLGRPILQRQLDLPGDARSLNCRPTMSAATVLWGTPQQILTPSRRWDWPPTTCSHM